MESLSKEYKAPPLKSSEKISEDLKKESFKDVPIYGSGEYATWFMPTRLEQLLDLKQQYPKAKLVSGNTEIGIEQRFLKAEYPYLISPTRVKELNELSCNKNGLKIGAATSLSDINNFLHNLYEKDKKGGSVETPIQRGVRGKFFIESFFFLRFFFFKKL